MSSEPKPEPARPPRIAVRVAVDVRDWVHQHMTPGGLFTSEGHAIEVATLRAHWERKYLRQECRRLGVPYRDAAYWAMMAELIRESQPLHPGRSGPNQVFVEREQIRGFVDESIGQLLEGDCRPAGPFESASHAVETYLRHLRKQDTGQNAAPAAEIPLDRKST